MKQWMMLAVALFSMQAMAQTVLACTTGCPDRYYWETQPCTGGLCDREWAPLPSEFQSNKGMSFAAYEGAMIQVCAAPGYTLSGTGTLRVWTWTPWLPRDVSTSPALDLDLADADSGTECSYSMLTDGGVISGVGAGDGGTNIKYRCRCAHWLDWKVGGFSSRRVILQAVNVAVSDATVDAGDGGTTTLECPDIEVRVVGLGVIR